MARAAPRRPGTPTWALAPPRALPSGAQPRIHQKPCAPAASLRAGSRLRGSPSWPLLALHHVHTRLGHHQALFTRTFWKPPGQHRKPSPRHPRGRVVRLQSLTPQALGQFRLATPPLFSPAPEKVISPGKLLHLLRSTAGSQSCQELPPAFFFSLLASVPLLQVLPLLPDGLF